MLWRSEAGTYSFRAKLREARVIPVEVSRSSRNPNVEVSRNSRDPNVERRRRRSRRH